MPEQTKIAIVGWGNIGRGVYEAIQENPDMDFAGLVTRRPKEVTESSHSVHDKNILDLNKPESWTGLDADIAILCGGSKDDLPIQGPFFARRFNTVDSFDTHKKIGDYVDENTQSPAVGYFNTMNAHAKVTGHLSAISFGWDPGTFSLERVMMDAFLPGAKAYAFYGLSKKGGLSMGHSDALRTIKGVKDARQYTHAIQDTIKRVRKGEILDLTARDMHWRECFIVLENDTTKEKKRVEAEAKTMPRYFVPYETTVTFVNQKGLDRINRERGMRHDGLVVAVGSNGEVLEYKNIWPSNPEGTAGILVATARAVHRLHKEGKIGAITSLDIAPAYYHPCSREELIARLL